MISAIIFAALLLTLPVPLRIRNQTKESEVATELEDVAETRKAKLRLVFDEAIRATLMLRMLKPQSGDRVKLPFTLSESKPRATLKEQMLVLINTERAMAGLKPWVMDAQLTMAARKHSADMLARGYFSHYSPDGKSPFDRLRAEKIAFLLAEEISPLHRPPKWRIPA